MFQIAKLIRIRRENPAFHPQADVWTFDTGSNHVLGIGRYYQGQKLLAIFNFGDSKNNMPADREYVDLMSGICTREIQVNANSFVWIKEK